MGDVLPFKAPKAKSKGNTLCRNGFHKWETATETKFDVKQGKLITLRRCLRCGKTKVQGT